MGTSTNTLILSPIFNQIFNLSFVAILRWKIYYWTGNENYPESYNLEFSG